MDLRSHYQTLRSCLRRCPDWSSRGAFLRSVYQEKFGLRRDATIRFSYPPPVGRIQLVIRSRADHFIAGEVFDHRYYELPMDPPATILDLGSHAGYTAVYFARRWPTADLVCVEPCPENLRLLKINLRSNGVRARVIESAVASEDGTSTLRIDAKDYGHRLEQTGGGASVRVRTLSVESILRRTGWPRIGLLKCDIEGAERDVFFRNEGWLSRVDAVGIEWHFEDARDRLCEIASRWGFNEPQRLPGLWFLSRNRE